LNKAKVLFIDTPLEPPGGGQMSLLLILQYLDRKKFEPFVFIPEKGEFEVRAAEKNTPCALVSLKKLFFAIRRARPSVIHCNSATTKYTFYSALAAKLLKIPFIWHVRVTESGGWRDKLISSLCTKIIVISDSVREKFEGIADRKKLVKIHNGVDTELFRPGLDVEYLFREFQIESNRKIVGVFSRLDPWKGHALFFEAAKSIREKCPDAVFLIVGEGEKEYKAELARIVDERGLKDVVLFAGFRKDIPQLMNICEVIVNPSLMPESFGRTIIEAMACGKAVVATKIGGPIEVIEEGVSGLLVPEKNSQMLAQACLHLLENLNRAREMGLRGRKRAVEFFSAEKITKEIEKIYEELTVPLEKIE